MQTNGRNKVLWYAAFPMLILALVILQLPAQAQMTSVGIPCSMIPAYHMMMQDNMGAGLVLIECGLVQGGKPAADGDQVTGDSPQPPNILVSNRSCTSANSCTKSESSVWHSAKPGDQTVVVNYNDHNGNNYSGTSYSTDGGATFTEILPAPLGTGHGTNYGDPIVVYNLKQQKWYAGDLVTGCGGLGVGLWTSPDGQNWTTGACAHNNSSDDRESFWVDNNPFSTKYGRMYISFNNFNIGSGALEVTYSDDGTTWSTPAELANGNPFIRDVQVTGTPPASPLSHAGYTSTVFVAGMDEGGGGNASRQNIMYRSTDGGVTWTSATMGPRFNPVGDGLCSSNGYFEQVNPIWRHMGWGEPGVGINGVVHYVYAGQGQQPNDHGDIYYVRSTDNGSTWSAPIKLNDDPGGQYKTQWMPSLSVNYNLASPQQVAKVTVSWYDRRQATSACNNVTDPGCSYYRYGIQSADNGVTWTANFQISDQLIPEPAQDDPGVVNCYAGDYDYATAIGTNAYVTWTDGRVAVGGVQVQNVEYATVPEP